MPKNKLEQLKEYTTIVADTGDFESIKQYHPTDATTNPSLILQAAEKEEYKHLIQDAVAFAKKHRSNPSEFKELLLDKLMVNFGIEILKIVPGRVSTEVNATLSYDTEASVNKARELIQLYEKSGVDRKRILIKLASTWEGIQAAKILENEGIHCNMTLMFCLAQAIGCADAKATLISPFVGRILDWHKKNSVVAGFAPDEDPGVKSVSAIYHYFKKFGYQTQIMGASFRNVDEILELAGCDLLTISPKLLNDLENSFGDVPRKLDPTKSIDINLDKIAIDEKKFRWMLSEDPMATEKLSEGIRVFAADGVKLENAILSKYV